MATEYERPTDPPHPVTKNSGNMAMVIAIGAIIAVGALVFFTFADTNGGPTSISTKPIVTAPERTAPKTTSPPTNIPTPAPTK